MLLFTEGPHGPGAAVAVAERAGHAVRGALVGGRVPDGQRALRAGPDPAQPGGPGPAPGVRPVRDAALGPAQLRAVHAGRAQHADGPEVRADGGGAPRVPAALRGSVVHGPAAARARLPGDDRRPVPGAGGRPELRSMLAGAAEPIAAPMPELDAVFARVARESEGIQDLDDLGQVPGRRRLVSGRGHRASLPADGHARPEYLVADGQGGLVVRHYNRDGRVREYDFAALPVAAPMQASLAAAVRRPVHAGPLVRALPRPRHAWLQPAAVRASSWPGSSGRRATWTSSPRGWCGSGGRACTGPAATTPSAMVRGLLRDDARLQAGPVADELARRSKAPRSTVQSYSEAEFDQITAAARRRFRAALQRINDNALHLQRWRDGAFAEGSRGLGDRRGAGHPGPHRGPAQVHRARTGSATSRPGTATHSAGRRAP